MYLPIPNEALKPIVDAKQFYAAYLDAKREAKRNSPRLTWESRGQSQYLISTLNSHGTKIKKSLGPRSPETEAIYETRSDRRAHAMERWEGLQKQYTRQVRINRALMLGNAPETMVSVLQVLDDSGLSRNFRIVGTNAIYAYASAASVQFDEDLTATQDVDLLWDSRSRLSIASPNPRGLAGLLQTADSTFGKMSDQFYTLVNKNGYQIDLIKRDEGRNHSEPGQLWANAEDFWAVKVNNMDWLLSAPRFSSTVIGANGEMGVMETVDPRAFVLFKYWLSERPERDPYKARRDLMQAQIVQRLVEEWLPQLSFQDVAVFPQKVRDRTTQF